MKIEVICPQTFYIFSSFLGFGGIVALTVFHYVQICSEKLSQCIYILNNSLVLNLFLEQLILLDC